jgi:hypothetical protein
MHAFKCRPHLQRLPGIDIEQAGTLGDDEGPHALAWRQKRVAHGLDETRSARTSRRQETVKMGLDRPGEGDKPLFELQLRD